MSSPFDPDAYAKTTNTFQVGMVRREEDGKIIEVAQWIPSQRLANIHTIRTSQRRERKTALFSCFFCGQPVLLKQHISGGHFFSHHEKSAAEKANCIYREERSIPLEDVDRMRYQGMREGVRHVRTKELVRRILAADLRFSDTVVERPWRTFDAGWRKPDVATTWDGKRLVFEAQVSNTYPQVVAERTDFYCKQGALLLWIFDQLPESNWRTLHADTFCANHQHLFLVDEECVAESERTGLAHFRVYFQRPDVVSQRSEEDGRHILIPMQRESFELCRFDRLTLDTAHQTASLFNVELERRRAAHKVLCAQAQAGLSYAALEINIKEIIGRSAEIPRANVEGWAALVCAIEAQRLHIPVGTRLANAAGVLNLVYDHHPAFLSHLIAALERLALDPPEARKGAWKQRVADFHNGRYRNGPLPAPHKGAEQLLAWLYPDEHRRSRL